MNKETISLLFAFCVQFISRRRDVGQKVPEWKRREIWHKTSIEYIFLLKCVSKKGISPTSIFMRMIMMMIWKKESRRRRIKRRDDNSRNELDATFMSRDASLQLSFKRGEDRSPETTERRDLLFLSSSRTPSPSASNSVKRVIQQTKHTRRKGRRGEHDVHWT